MATKQEKLTLLKAMHFYPGGLGTLLDDTNMTRPTFYRVANGWHAECPEKLLIEIRVAFSQLTKWDQQRVQECVGWRPWVQEDLNGAWDREARRG